MLLYIHVPFCYKKCYYCAFYSQPIEKAKKSHDIIQNYIQTLLQEITFWSNKLIFQPITSIFFGGGTPSILQPQEIQKILDNITKKYPLTTDVEITLETNPESLQRKKQIKDYLSVGVNRFSLGFQSLNDQELTTLGRTHTVQKAHQAYILLRDAQCKNINIDLIWGLPNQTLKQWLKTLQKTIELKPNHLSLYNLTIEKKTAFKKKQKELLLPSENEQVQMYLQSISLLADKGFEQYEISNFAQKGYQCVQNNGYWSRSNYLGLGPSATSTILPYRWTNPKTLSSWSKHVTKQKIPIKEYLDPSTQAQELLMLRLRTTIGLSLHEYHEITGHDFIQMFEEIIAPSIEKKILLIKNMYVKLTPKGMLISDVLLQKFFEKLKNKTS